jgi:hypothetical protein
VKSPLFQYCFHKAAYKNTALNSITTASVMMLFHKAQNPLIFSVANGIFSLIFSLVSSRHFFLLVHITLRAIVSFQMLFVPNVLPDIVCNRFHISSFLIQFVNEFPNIDLRILNCEDCII